MLLAGSNVVHVHGLSLVNDVTLTILELRIPLQ